MRKKGDPFRSDHLVRTGIDMTFMKTLSIAALATTLASVSFAQDVQDIKPLEDIDGQRLGALECTIEGGWGMLLGSSKDVACTFAYADGQVEKYKGSLDRLGIDVGKTNDSYMTWVVFTTAENIPGEYSLAGEYTGVSAEASLGIGLGANALIGGSDKSIGLQPVSVQGVEGLNVAVGLASLTLEADAS